MNLENSLFKGALITLSPIDREADPETESSWTHDVEFLRMTSLDPVRPMAPSIVKKKYEALEKEVEEKKNIFYFTIRTLDEGRLVGYARLYHVDWSNASGMVQVAIGDPASQAKGYRREAHQLLLRYAFHELNLNRVGAVIPEYNQPELERLSGAGFIEEVRQRQAVNRDGRRWDLVWLGLLRDEWLQASASSGP